MFIKYTSQNGKVEVSSHLLITCKWCLITKFLFSCGFYVINTNNVSINKVNANNFEIVDFLALQK